MTFINNLQRWMKPLDKRRSRISSVSANVELLEKRILLYTLSGTEWPDTNISFSFLPDGTLSAKGFQPSSLFAMLDAKAPTNVWQAEAERALNTWGSETNLTFTAVTDDGSSSGTTGLAQGDSRFGDIRFGAANLSSIGFVGFSYFPSSFGTLGGDVTISTHINWQVGSSPNIYAIFLHEIGHSLGLDHNNVFGSVMYPLISGDDQPLWADDIAGIRAIYGAPGEPNPDPPPPTEPPPEPEPEPDVADRFETNDSFDTATKLGKVNNVNEDGLTFHTVTDTDFYTFTSRKNNKFTFTATNADIILYNSERNVVDTEISLVAGDQYYISVSSSDDSVAFYDLSISKEKGKSKSNGNGHGKPDKGSLPIRVQQAILHPAFIGCNLLADIE